MNYGTLDGIAISNSELFKLIAKHLKQGTAKKLVDTQYTLMYELTDKKN